MAENDKSLQIIIMNDYKKRIRNNLKPLLQYYVTEKSAPPPNFTRLRFSMTAESGF